MLALGTAVAASAAGMGKYQGNVDVRDAGPKGQLQYTLSLEDRDRATMHVKSTARFSPYTEAVRRYGLVLRGLQDAKAIDFEGTWRRDGDEVFVTFDRTTFDDGADPPLRLAFRSNGANLNLLSWDSDYFGDTAQPTLTKVGGNGGDVLAGVAVLAAGALLVRPMQDRDRHDSFRDRDRYDRWDDDRDGGRDSLDYRTGGDGTLRFGNGDRLRIDRARFNLRRGGAFTIDLDGDDDVQLRGRWRRSGSNYQLTVDGVTIARRRTSARGSGMLLMRNGSTANSFSFSIRIDGEQESGSLSFRPARG